MLFLEHQRYSNLHSMPDISFSATCVSRAPYYSTATPGTVTTWNCSYCLIWNEIWRLIYDNLQFICSLTNMNKESSRGYDNHAVADSQQSLLLQFANWRRVTTPSWNDTRDLSNLIKWFLWDDISKAIKGKRFRIWKIKSFYRVHLLNQ